MCFSGYEQLLLHVCHDFLCRECMSSWVISPRVLLAHFMHINIVDGCTVSVGTPGVVYLWVRPV